ncbi:MAG: TolC family protein [Phycisphaeraceae bacterium]|nr:MAG: TolC family protein [Phycisphaeraceae bacterium]
MTSPKHVGRRLRVCVGAISGAMLLSLSAGCESPLRASSEAELRRSVVEKVQRELAESKANPALRETTRDVGVSRLDLKPETLKTLDEMAGPGAYAGRELPLPDDLTATPARTVTISLEHAIRSAVERNLQVQFARLAPAVSGAQLVTAEAAFDWTFFSNLEYSNVDEPRSRQSTSGILTGVSSEQRQAVSSTTGLRKPLETGGSFQVQQELIYTDNSTPGLRVSPDPASQLAVTVQLDQPLLRNFGSDVALAQVRLSRNAERESVARLKRDLISTVTDTERAYWQVVQAKRDLEILRRLLERGVEVRDQLAQRRTLDATPAQIADATARVERRRADLLRAQTALRRASDRLKLLINDPDLPVGGEVILLPADSALDAPVAYSLADSITTALEKRPEIQQAILSIDDTSIRQRVAEQNRLPQLDMRLQTRFLALEDNAGEAYENLDGSFVDYLVGLFFEQQIGNRAPEAELRRRRIERMQATISYQNTVQQIVLEVKNALDNMTTSYKLIEQTRTSRYAATEVLRALLVEKETIRGYTVERLDLELNRQESLANAEREEVAALIDYNVSLAELAAATGMALERNRIDFKVEDPPMEGWRIPVLVNDPRVPASGQAPATAGP